MDDVWKKQQGYECWENQVHKTCLGFIPTAHLWEATLCHRYNHQVDAWQKRSCWHLGKSHTSSH
jgi:hypothetical protein